jgi:light-regulated signal transduction histidine kinase (bacteriophytochrome)
VAARTLQLEAVNAELEAFAFSVSHDLATPLRHVIGFADLLVQDAGDRLGEEDRDSLVRITRAAERMNGMIAQLLDFSRLGRSILAKEPVNLGDIVQLARSDLEPDLVGREVEWSVTALPDVDADPALMRLVMVNLLSNALKFTRGRTPAQISIGTRREPETGEVVVWVRDNGAGFDMRNSSRLFGVFQRWHSETQFEGTGIGLANVRRIVARHGGRVWADALVDGGATFYVALPAESDSQ